MSVRSKLFNKICQFFNKREQEKISEKLNKNAHYVKNTYFALLNYFLLLVFKILNQVI